MTRHASVHAAGVVIAPRAITEYAPLYKGARDEITTQWSMKEIERIGLLKMDFLGLSTLTLIFDAIARDQADDRRSSSTSTRMPLDDAKTYQIFQDGQTYGIFQFESSGMRDILRKAKPQRLEDLIALNALYRPGPLRSGMVDDFIARKQGKTEVKYELPQLEPILRRDLRRHRLSGTGDAHLERAGRLHARRGRPAAQGDGQEEPRGDGEAARQVRRRARRRTGITEKKAAHIFELMEHFAGYGFNKSHSTAYAFLAYQTAYLKANYPVALRGRAADDRGAEHRQARAVPRRVPRARHSGAAARHQREPAALHRRARQGRPLRPDRDQERRRGRDRVAARACGRSRGASRRCTRSARTSICGWSTSACSRAWSRPARSIRSPTATGARRPAAAGAAAAAARGHRRGVRARRAASSATATKGRRSCSAGSTTMRRRAGSATAGRDARCRRRRRGPRPSSWRSRRRRSGLYWSGHPVDRYAAELEGVRRAVDRRARRRSRSTAPRDDALGARRAEADRARHQHRRHRRRLPAAEDAQGRSHGGLHARGRRRAASR